MQLNADRFATKILSLEGILNDIDENICDLNPEYQRGIVWNETQQQKVIDTVLRQYPLPAVFFKPININKIECVDGKQRLTSLYKFWNNELSIPNLEEYTDVTEDYIYFKDLKEPFKKKFKHSQITTIQLINNWSDADIYDLFHRVQNGKTLTNGELFNAMIHNKFIKNSKRFTQQNTENIRKLLHKSCDNHYQLLELIVGLCAIQHYNSFEPLTPVKLTNFVNEISNNNSSFDYNFIAKYIQIMVYTKNKKHPNFKKKRKYVTKWDYILGFKICLNYLNQPENIQRKKMFDFITFIKDIPKPSKWSPNSFGRTCLINRESIFINWQTNMKQFNH